MTPASWIFYSHHVAFSQSFFFKCALRNCFHWTWDFYLIKFYSQKICWKIQFHQGSNIRWSEKFQNVCCRSLRYILQISLIIKHFFYQTPSSYVMLLHGVWKSQKKVSFTIASDASYIYILSGLKFIKNVKNSQFWRVFEHLKFTVKQCYQTSQF